MNELDTLEFGEVIKKDLGSENSSMLRGISILESLASLREPASLAQLMQITKMPKASLHRTLAIFEEAGLVVREPGGKTYAPGERLSRLALETLCHDSVSAIRHGILRKLVTDLKETCNLAILRRGELFYLDRVELIGHYVCTCPLAQSCHPTAVRAVNYSWPISLKMSALN